MRDAWFLETGALLLIITNRATFAVDEILHSDLQGYMYWCMSYIISVKFSASIFRLAQTTFKSNPQIWYIYTNVNGVTSQNNLMR
jgi:hypothetical protein